LAVDYRGAVQNGEVVSPTEFAEMTEFAATAYAMIAALPASDAKADLQQRAAGLQRLIADKAPDETVATAARALAARIAEALGYVGSQNRGLDRALQRVVQRAPALTPIVTLARRRLQIGF
jgi:high-affinity iron transporter